MSDTMALLEESIADVGYWRWWAEAFPDAFQVEFGGVQLLFSNDGESSTPGSVLALRLLKPSVVAFLTEKGAQNVPKDWRLALHEDRIDPFSISYDQLTLRSEEAVREIAADCDVEFLVGSGLEAPTGAVSVVLAFRAGPVGLVARAQEMEVVTAHGALPLEQIHKASEDWWAYWREYWRRRDTDTPLPKDYACEVTVPIKRA